MRISEAEYVQYWARVKGTAPAPEKSQKPHKYRAQKVTIDGIPFASKWEGQCYVTLLWQVKAGLITEPLLQVPFALGKQYGRQVRYIADFAYIDLKAGRLIVADAKGMETPEYKRKRRTFAEVYGFCITEMKHTRKL